MFDSIALGGDIVRQDVFVLVVADMVSRTASRCRAGEADSGIHWCGNADDEQLYDIPTISMRNLVLPTVLANSSAVREWFFRKTDPNMLKDTDPADEFFDIDLRHVGVSDSFEEDG